MSNMPSGGPLGVFDSGMGGLTVLRAMRDKLPSEDILYFGDTAHLPYGTKSPEAVKRYSMHIADFFVARKVKLMVIACNTASVFALDELTAKLDIPVIGVVEPGVKTAVAAAKNSIAVIGTYGMVKSGVYQEKIARINSGLNIFSKACPLFVPLAEEGWLDTPVTRQIAGIYLDEFRDKVDTVILACTHYPMLKKVIRETLGDTVSVVDSAREVAKEVELQMKELNILNASGTTGASEVFVSDLTDNLRHTGEIFMDSEIGEIKEVHVD